VSFPNEPSVTHLAKPSPYHTPPFPGYKHAAGLLSGLTAGVLAMLMEHFVADVQFMGVGLCTLGALHSYVLSLQNRSLSGSLLALNGGFLLGVMSYGLVAFFASDPAQLNPGLVPRLANPLLFLALCPLLGTGPLLLVLFFQEARPRGTVMRLFLGTVSVAFAAAAGLVAYNVLADFGVGGSETLWSEHLARAGGFAMAGYVLFRLHLLCLWESASGDTVQSPT